jgi:hypothetical protein
MAIEWVDVITWIYQRLSEDDELKGLLTGASNVRGYQQGIYTDMAPQADPISGQSPLSPFIIVALADGGIDERVLCGQRITASPSIRITAWDRQSGSVSYARIKPIMDRVDYLIDNQNSTSSPSFWIRRDSGDVIFPDPSSGITDYGITATYQTLVTVEIGV